MSVLLRRRTGNQSPWMFQKCSVLVKVSLIIKSEQVKIGEIALLLGFLDILVQSLPFWSVSFSPVSFVLRFPLPVFGEINRVQVQVRGGFKIYRLHQHQILKNNPQQPIVSQRIQ